MSLVNRPQTNLKVPKNYKCKKCKIHGHKLWRYAACSCVELICVRCLEKESGERLDIGREGPGGYDQLGGHVPAIPDTDGSWWSYTSVPEKFCKWWYDLPL